MKNFLFAITVKQPIVFPQAPLYNVVKFAYPWLNLFSFSNLAFIQIYIVCASKSDNKILYSLVFLKALYLFLFLRCQHCLYYWTIVLSFWFMFCTILLIVYLWEQIGGEVYAWFGCIDNFKIVHYVIASLHLKALEHFTFSGFSASVVYAKKLVYVCLVILLLHLICICINYVLQNLSSTCAMLKTNQSDASYYGSRAYTLLKFLTSQNSWPM